MNVFYLRPEIQPLVNNTWPTWLQQSTNEFLVTFILLDLPVTITLWKIRTWKISCREVRKISQLIKIVWRKTTGNLSGNGTKQERTNESHCLFCSFYVSFSLACNDVNMYNILNMFFIRQALAQKYKQKKSRKTVQ